MDKININTENYNFLSNDFFINHPICYLTLSGSHAYGTNNSNSDVDIRGFYLDDVNEFLTICNNKEEYIDEETDTVLYSLKKFIKLLMNCNPNVIELLGTNNNHILFINNSGQLLRDNYHLFLSKKVYVTFIGYATSQLRRLENAMEKNNNKEEQILHSLQAQLLQDEYNFSDLDLQGNIHIFIDDIIKCNILGNNIPLRQLINYFKGLETTINNFDKINHRNKKKDSNHLYKHAMHLIRLYLMGIDILKEQKINTYRKENKLLMDIRNGKLSMKEIFELKDNLQIEIDQVYKYTTLPNELNINKINELLLSIYKNNLLKNINIKNSH